MKVLKQSAQPERTKLWCNSESILSQPVMFRDVRSEMPFVVSAQAWLQSARWHRWGSDALGVQQTVHINSAWPDMPGLRAESQQNMVS